MPKPSAQSKPSGESNLLWATCLLTACAFFGSLAVACLSDYVLTSFNDSSTMALLITDAGLKSDDAKLQGQLTTATKGLQACRDVGWALAVGCAGVGVAVFLRTRRQNAS